ncbi:flagellar export protein FliJ [Treponema putidum]|uniref:Flagellar FliJ protein n=1 Tax=Treponema putidum TaxID=221027 RepID=A0AAE9MRW2_9SPIR|nr:flagellar export protein FliJ [Treponema putidum]TWI77099.1 flagellar FliJ protein [Treponema putidum]UTY28923.1 flagellar export protein FliJ [Treponema putidum]UTY31339.1 flagellar export protein FliJ [Treponema putidum]UTY33775.1 flagellar export protein FliJ [Treponema putidum]
MKRFEFRLEKLLALRSFCEHQAEIELAHAIAHKDYIDLELRQIAKLKAKTSLKFNPQSDEISIPDLHNAQNYIIFLDKKKDKLLEQLIIAEQIIDEKRKIYIEAASKRKVISKLKEKKHEIWKKENMKAEEKYIDDIITYKFGKNNDYTNASIINRE